MVLQAKKKDLWNAAGVSFYEHLGDSIETRQAMNQWVDADTYKEIRGLIELCVQKNVLKEIDELYNL